MTRRRYLLTTALEIALGPDRPGLVIQPDDEVDFDAEVVPATEGRPALTLGAALGRYASAFGDALAAALPSPTPVAASSAPTLPSSGRVRATADGEKQQD